MAKRGAEKDHGPAAKKQKTAVPEAGTPIRVKATGRIGKLASSPDDSPVPFKLEFGDGLEPKEGSFAPDKVEYLLFRDRANRRIGKLVKHTPGEELSHKLEFSDGAQPNADWYSLDKIEVALFRVKADGRIGTLVQHTPEDKSSTHKLKFSDERKPDTDWFLETALDEQPTLERLHQSAECIRTEVKNQLGRLQKELGTHWQAYSKRMKTLATTKTGVSIGKIIVGFIPGAHAVAEGATAVSLMTELKTEVEEVGNLVFDMAALYEAGSANLANEEDKLLAVLTRKVRFMGEDKTGGFTEEPGKQVVQTLMEIKSLSMKLRTLDEMSFHSIVRSSSSSSS